MKLIYEKPMMAVERYELTQSIATCVTKIGLLNSECVIKDPDAPGPMKDYAEYYGYFISGACDLSGEALGEYNGICYHTTANAAFSS